MATTRPGTPQPTGQRRTSSTLLEVRDLKTHFFLDEGVVRAVDGVSFDVGSDSVLGVVGESGCGKSVLARTLMQIVRPPGRIVDGSIKYFRANGAGNAAAEPIDLVQLQPDGEEMRSIRGGDIAMIFQEPMVSFSPVHTVGQQIVEAIMLHEQATKADARARAVEMLRRVGIPNPGRRFGEYPFRLSGGMRQRAMIAMALSTNPRLLIADEPTTALDVTTQAQILELIAELRAEFGMAMILITHNLGVVAQMANQIAVMYLGKIVEYGEVDVVYREPKHPYTRELLRSIPRLARAGQKNRLTPIKGSVPPPYSRPPGCTFHPRCPDFMPGKCDVIEPALVSIGARRVNCLLYADGARAPAPGPAA